MWTYRKGMVDTLVLVLIAAALIGASFILLHITNLFSIIKIKGEVNVFLNIEDRGSEILSFLRSERNGMNYMEILGLYTTNEVPPDLEKEITTTLGRFKDYHLVVRGPSGVIKEFKSVKSPTGSGTLQGLINLNWPLKTSISIKDGYGWRTVKGDKEFHGGVSFAAPEGIEVYSAYPKGRVVKVGKNCKPSSDFCEKVDDCIGTNPDPQCCCHDGIGNHIVIEHAVGGEKFYTHYYHLSEVYVNVGYELGKDIKANQPIGKSGKTGLVKRLMGEHLYFELSKSEIRGDKPIDPCPYFPQPVPANCEHESHRSESLSVSIPLPNGQIGSVELMT